MGCGIGGSKEGAKWESGVNSSGNLEMYNERIIHLASMDGCEYMKECDSYKHEI